MASKVVDYYLKFTGFDENNDVIFVPKPVVPQDGKIPSLAYQFSEAIWAYQKRIGQTLTKVSDLSALIKFAENMNYKSTCWCCGSRSFIYHATYDVPYDFGFEGATGVREMHEIICNGCGNTYALEPDESTFLLSNITNRDEVP